MSHNTRTSNLAKPEVRVAFTRQDVARFWAKVNRSEGCWLWASSRGGSLGYGMFGVSKIGRERGRWTFYAHRIAWELSHGSIPDGQQIRHRCDNPICVNPDHLQLGTHDDNMRDAQERGRLHKPRPGKQTVSDAQVAEIFQMAAGGKRQIDIARQFGLSKGYVCLVLQGKRRQYGTHVTEHRRAS